MDEKINTQKSYRKNSSSVKILLGY